MSGTIAQMKTKSNPLALLKKLEKYQPKGFIGSYSYPWDASPNEKTKEELIKELNALRSWINKIIKSQIHRKEAEKALTELSFKDDLTGLYNRRGFFALAEQSLKAAQRMGKEMMLIFGDVDNLKEINDNLGHTKGDQALLELSNVLKKTFRASDIIGRIGGDEFVILANNSDKTSAQELTHRLNQILQDNHSQTKYLYPLSMSLGIAFFNPNNPCSIDVLLAQADSLMYENKHKKGK